MTRRRLFMKQPDPAVVRALEQGLPCNRRMARLLANREIRTVAQARAFVHPSLDQLRPRTAIKDMDAAVARIHRAIEGRQKILVFGDYDADGVTATVLMLTFLRSCRARVAYYIPDRMSEGYGLRPEHIPRVAAADGIELIVTVDCGSSSHAAVTAAGQAGIDVIVTDHHRIESVPPAVAVVNPMRSDCPSEMRHLAGVGVAFYLAMHLRRLLRERGHWPEGQEPNLMHYCDLAALGTVADMVPLVRENRVMVSTGLRLINAGRRTGVKALAMCTAHGQPEIDAEDIAFRLAPHLNAAGRMGHAARAAELLLCENRSEADRLANELARINQQRRAAQQTLLTDAEDCLARQPHLLRPHSLVMAGDNWHEGILGIVAARLVKTHGRPVLLMASDGRRAKGSARSVPGVDLHAALTACSCFLDAFGGHAMAAGLQMDSRRIDAFRDAFDAAVAGCLQGREPNPPLEVDERLPIAAIDEALMDVLQRLAPFGNGNPEPLFAADRFEMVSRRVLSGRHVQMAIRPAGSARAPSFPAIHFDGALGETAGAALRQLTFRLRWNHWQGRRSIQLVVAQAE